MFPADANLQLNNLPQFLTAFIGREAEVGKVKQELAAARLLTLTGPGGGGKTRLALQVAAEVIGDFRDGTWWCDLAGVTDPAYVPPTINSALRLAAPADRTPLENLTGALRGQQALLVLDNCEHLLPACAALSLAVLSACPGVRILATSLQPLGLPQERVWPVPPLSVTERAEAGSAVEPDAVRLFVDRATRAMPSFRLTAENRPAVLALCRQLDGLPLALELAAARTRLLTVDQIGERLGDAFGLLTRGSLSSLPRHQTLRLALDWSYQFLSSDEQVLLRRLAVFAGPFTLSAVEAVCGDAAGSAGVLDRLDGLADKSFVALLPRDAAGEAHCRLLEVIRQYARERLEESGEAARIRDHYLQWCLDWAEPAANHLTGPNRGAWLAEFESRQEHFRAALRWACTHRRAEAGLRLAGALGHYWMTRGLSDGRAWLEELLSVAGAPAADRPAASAPPVPDLVRAWALLYSGRLAARQGDPAHGLRRGEESLALFRAAANDRGCLAALNLLALAAQGSNDYRQAEERYAEGLALSRQSRDERMTGVLLVNQGLMYYEQQDYRRAAPIWDEAYAIIERLNDYSNASRDNLACLEMMQGQLAHAQELLEHELERQGQVGDPFALAILMMDLGEVARRQGDFDRAEAWLRQALERQEQLGDRYRLGETLANLGSLARNRGELKAAQAIYVQSLTSLERVGYTRLTSQVQTCLGLLAAEQGHDEEALALFQRGLRIAQDGQHELGRVEALEGMAGVLARRGETQRAARWLAVTQAARETLGAPVPPVERDPYDQRRWQVPGTVNGETQPAEGGFLALERIAAEALDLAEARPTASAVVEAQRIPELRIRALGPTRVLVGERTLEPADWTYSKSKELLFYLLSRGSASKAQIGLDLWPDASPNQLRAAFHSALHHLRRALGRPDWIVHANGEYRFNSDLPLDYDVRSFEDHLSQAQLASRSPAQPNARSETIDHLESSASLWQGDFLSDVEAGEWAVYQRETLRQLFLDSLLRLADLRFAEAHYTAAADVFRRALSLDGYLELAHRGLMRCYARQGEAGRAARHYLDLRQLLQADLSTAPSPETTLLYNRIRRGDDI